jgi:hypothetical protein
MVDVPGHLIQSLAHRCSYTVTVQIPFLCPAEQVDFVAVFDWKHELGVKYSLEIYIRKNVATK